MDNIIRRVIFIVNASISLIWWLLVRIFLSFFLVSFSDGCDSEFDLDEFMYSASDFATSKWWANRKSHYGDSKNNVGHDNARFGLVNWKRKWWANRTPAQVWSMIQSAYPGFAWSDSKNNVGHDKARFGLVYWKRGANRKFELHRGLGLKFRHWSSLMTYNNWNWIEEHRWGGHRMFQWVETQSANTTQLSKLIQSVDQHLLEVVVGVLVLTFI